MQTTNNAIDLQLIKNECESRIDSFFSQFGIISFATACILAKDRLKRSQKDSASDFFDRHPRNQPCPSQDLRQDQKPLNYADTDLKN
jgi:hypothetical protein